MATQEHPDEEPINLSPHIGLPDSPSTMATQEHPDEEPILDELNDQHQRIHRQPVKLCSSLKKLTSLQLTEDKKKLMESSVFYQFLQIENSKESSASLISGLCKFYNIENQMFVFNNETTFSFCIEEVACVLGIKYTGTDYKVHLGSGFPPFVFDLKREFSIGNRNQFTAADLKKILSDMPIDTDSRVLYFKQLISYFLVEQMLLCSGNPKMPRSSFWGLVTDLKVFEEINWAKAVFDHIFESLKVLKEKETAGISGQRLFKGAAPVLEAILYERIASVRPPNLNVEFPDPPIQKYGAQRSDFSEKLHKLTPDQIKPCPWCGFQRLALEDGAGFQGLAMEDGACSPAPSLAEVAPEKNGATTPKKAPPKPRNTKKADTTAPIAEPMETSSSAMETAPGALRRSTRIRTPRAPLSPSPLPTKKSRPKKGC